MPSSLRFAIRQLVKSPGFTAVVVLTLAIGLGATTAIYSVVSGVLLRPLDFREPDRLYFLAESIHGSGFGSIDALPVSARHFTEWRKQSRSFESLSVIAPGTATLTGNGEPERLEGLQVSANFFQTLGVQPALGRGFRTGEDEAGRERVVVLSNQLWQRKYHSDPKIIGASITLDEEVYTVVGILPADLHFPSAHAFVSYFPVSTQPDLFRPKVFSAGELGTLMGDFNYGAIGRLGPGVTATAAHAELMGICSQLARLAGQNVDLRAVVTPLIEAIVSKVRVGLLVLMSAIGAVWLILCVNLGNLLLIRAESRAADSAIRLALGARRAHLLSQSLLETMLLTFTGGILGMSVAAVALKILIHMAPIDIPRLQDVRLNGGVLLFAFALMTLTGLACGLGPAWRGAGGDPQSVLKSRGRTLAGSGRRYQATLIMIETGLSAALLILAGLLLASFTRLVRVPTGFSAPTVLAAEVSIPWTKYKDDQQKSEFFDRVIARLDASPGVVSAAITSALPLKGESWINFLWLPGDSRPLFDRPVADDRFISPEYFRTMGIPLLSGRGFSVTDRGKKVAVVSEQLAHLLWPGLDAVGRGFETQGSRCEVIGVAGDVRADAQKSAVAIVYHPYWNQPQGKATIVARAAGDPESIAAAIRDAVRFVDPDVPVPSLHTMQEVLDESLAQRHFQMVLAIAFAATALLSAALGIYGVLACSVARRTNEIGIRAALGARPSDLRWMVIRQGLTPVLVGLLGGVVGALGCGRILSSLLYETRPSDPQTLAIVTLTLIATAVAACLVPAMRATKVSPIEALREG